MSPYVPTYGIAAEITVVKAVYSVAATRQHFNHFPRDHHPVILPRQAWIYRRPDSVEPQ